MNAEQWTAPQQSGLTLLEMLVVLALLGILFGLAVPSAMNIIDHHRITAQVNYMSSVLQYTRHQAMLGGHNHTHGS